MTAMVGPFADATRTREHVRDVLMPYGLGCPRIAALAAIEGFREWDVWTLVNGRPDRGDPPPAVIPATVARAILAIHPGPDALAGGGTVDSLAARRMLQALVALGYGGASLARQLPCEEAHLRRVLAGRPRVSAAFARRARALYGQLWNIPAPEGTHRERQEASKARGQATRKGWLPPGAWDEAELADPSARPHPEWLRTVPQYRRGQAPCGTPRGYSRHRRRGEEPCEACKASRRKPRELAPCGTPGAAKRHWRRGERCETCLAAERRRVQDATARKREGLAELLGEDSEQEEAA
jgi:hypothetical protein